MARLKIGILGAGLGSRMQSVSKAKPLAKLGSGSILQLLMDGLKEIEPSSITCALREELLNETDKGDLPQGADYIFVNTDSSLHTLCELILTLGANSPILFTMADTIVKPADLAAFAVYCEKLPLNSCAVLVTPFVDDEKPLWVQVDSHNYVTEFGSEPGPFVTSGMYFLSPEALKNALSCLDQGMEKMRNFLASLVQQKVPIKTFVVSKTIDVDHPSDLEKAEQFLRSE